jgi:hypothetical protein
MSERDTLSTLRQLILVRRVMISNANVVDINLNDFEVPRYQLSHGITSSVKQRPQQLS